MPKRKKYIIKKEDTELRSIIGDKIKYARKHLGLTARFVAEKCNVSRCHITQIEGGRNNVSAVLLLKIAKALSCEVQDLLPLIPDAHSLQQRDFENVRKINERAANWFEKSYKNKI